MKVELNDEDDALILIIANGEKPYSIKLGGKNTFKTNFTFPNALFDKEKVYDNTIKGVNYSGILLENSIKLIAKTQGEKCKDQKQVTAAHEFGHLIGLDHPGQENDPPEDPNSVKDYEADPPALMGCGMKLKKKYFEKWKKQLNENRKTCCGVFSIKKAN